MGTRKLSTVGKFTVIYALAMAMVIAVIVAILCVRLDKVNTLFDNDIKKIGSTTVFYKARELNWALENGMKGEWEGFFQDSIGKAECSIWVLVGNQDNIVHSSDTSRVGKNIEWKRFGITDEDRLVRTMKLNIDHPFDFGLKRTSYVVFPSRLNEGWSVACLKNREKLYASVREAKWSVGFETFAVFLLVALLGTFAFVSRLGLLRNRSLKSTILESAGRDVRAQSNGILGMTRILLRELSNADHRNYVKNIQAASLNLLNVVNDMLEIARIENGNMTLNPTEYDMYSVLKDCFDTVSPKATAKNLHFSLECDPEIPSCLWGDEARIRQIVVNLLSNAILYTEVGEVSLSVGYDLIPKEPNALDENIRLRFIIKDSGNGVRDDAKESFLDRLLQAESQNKMHAGFSLQLTKRLVAMCGGELLVKSRYGEGSVYMLSIPQLVLNVEAMGDFTARYKNEAHVGKGNSEVFYAPSARILVIDDNEFNLKVVSGLLKETMVQIDTALSGAKALESVRIRHYDLILIDSMMPLMSGKDTYERMVRIADNPNRNTPVIVMASAVSDPDQDSYLSVGFADYIPKPLMEGDLLRVLRWYLPKQLILSREDVADDSTPSPDQIMLGKNESEPRSGAPAEKASGDGELEFVSLAADEKMARFSAFLDVKLGLTNCAEDVEFYREMLSEYVTDSKRDAIERAYGANDWDSYGIHMHSVKSMSLTIGAETLSNEAKAIEMAANDNRIEYVHRNHRRIMDMYVALMDNIAEGLKS